MRLEGGNTRVVFHLGIELQKLEATFNYESADVAPLASLSVQARHLFVLLHHIHCLSQQSVGPGLAGPRCSGCMCQRWW